jgi:hypothetical protein
MKFFLNCNETYNKMNTNDKMKTNDKINTKIMRESKITFNNILEYAFKYSQLGTTKRDIMSTLKKKAHRTSYDRKFKNISVYFFKDLFLQINKLFFDKISSNIELKNILKIINENFNEVNITNDNCYNIIAYDGTVNNRIQNNTLNTDQNLFGYDVNFNIPNTLKTNDTSTYNNKNNNSNKNSEITMFIDYIKTNPEKCKNNIFLGDRLYSVYDIFNIINENEGKYIFRLKDNLDILDDDKVLNNKDKNNAIKIAIKNNPNIKIIEYSEKTIKKIVKKTNEIVTIKFDSKFYLLTNLGDHENFSDKLIKNIYNSRWNIEVFNKYIKNNFKFEKFYLKNNEEIEKIKYLDLIISIITKLFVIYCLHEKNKTNKNLFNDEIKKRFDNKISNSDKRTKIYRDYVKNFKETTKATLRVNLTLFTKKFYEKIVTDLVYGSLKKETLINIMNEDLEIIKNETGRSFERKSIVPFTKWYIKMYHKMYEYRKIIDAIENNTIDKLNKNLKCKALSIQKYLIEKI